MALDLSDKTSNANNLTNVNSVSEYITDFPFAQSTTAAQFVAASLQSLTAVDSSSLKPTGNFSIQLWIKTTGSPTTGRFFQTYSQNTAVAGILCEIDGNGKARFVIGKNTGTTNGTDYNDLRSSTAINDNTWKHLCFTYDGSNMKIYIDGSSTADATLANTINPAYAGTNYVRIGCGNETGTEIAFLNAKLDDVRLWNKALTGAENAANYNSELAGTETNLQAYWPFESLASTTTSTSTSTTSTSTSTTSTSTSTTTTSTSTTSTSSSTSTTSTSTSTTSTSTTSTSTSTTSTSTTTTLAFNFSVEAI